MHNKNVLIKDASKYYWVVCLGMDPSMQCSLVGLSAKKVCRYELVSMHGVMYTYDYYSRNFTDLLCRGILLDSQP